MATCRECLHIDVCLKEINAPKDIALICDDFKNKSDYVKRERGEWIKFKAFWFDSDAVEGYEIIAVKCSLCGKESETKYNFCPNCGADMRKEDNNG